MFDVGFWELTLIAMLALLVLGPDRLPGVVNNIGRMLGRARSLARGLKMQIEREMNQATTIDPRPKARPGQAQGGAKPPPDVGKPTPGAPAGKTAEDTDADKKGPGRDAVAEDLHGETRPAE